MNQVNGYAQKTTCIFGINLTTTVIYVIRIMHHDTNIVNMGTEDFPAPRIIPAIQCENASKK